MVLSTPCLFSVTPNNCFPSYENSTRLMDDANSQVFSSFPDLMSQSLIVLSAAPEARSVVVGSTSTVQMAPTWPWYVPRRSPFALYHAQICWSFATEKMMSPSGEYLKYTRQRGIRAQKTRGE